MSAWLLDRPLSLVLALLAELPWGLGCAAAALEEAGLAAKLLDREPAQEEAGSVASAGWEMEGPPAWQRVVPVKSGAAEVEVAESAAQAGPLPAVPPQVAPLVLRRSRLRPTGFPASRLPLRISYVWVPKTPVSSLG